MFVLNAPSPVAFDIFGLYVYKYGIIMAFAIFVGMLAANKLFNLYGEKKDIIIEYAPLLIIAGIFGARIYFCLLNPAYYMNNPVEILDIRQGGLSIHGAVFAGILCLIYIAKKSKIHMLALLDSLSCGVILGQAIGRWGNYFNSEAFGKPVSGQSWGLFIPQNIRPEQFREFSYFHPAFLYESVLDILAFFVLLFVFLKCGKKYRGITFFLYLIIYALIRFFVEQIRLDSALNINGIPVAAAVSVLLFVSGIIGLAVCLNMRSENL